MIPLTILDHHALVRTPCSGSAALFHQANPAKMFLLLDDCFWALRRTLSSHCVVCASDGASSGASSLWRVEVKPKRDLEFDFMLVGALARIMQSLPLWKVEMKNVQRELVYDNHQGNEFGDHIQAVGWRDRRFFGWPEPRAQPPKRVRLQGLFFFSFFFGLNCFTISCNHFFFKNINFFEPSRERCPWRPLFFSRLLIFLFFIFLILFLCLIFFDFEFFFHFLIFFRFFFFF